MKEKILAGILVGCLEAMFFTACATAGSLFADCIKLKIQNSIEKKSQKEILKNT